MLSLTNSPDFIHSVLLFQLYIGSGNLQTSSTYSVDISGLRNRETTQALINGQVAPVNYLVSINTALFLSQLRGNAYVGGFSQITQIKVGPPIYTKAMCDLLVQMTAEVMCFELDFQTDCCSVP